jgi:hypothetical protein
MLRLTTHRVTESVILCLRNPGRTFFGTGIHVPKNVCHNGHLMSRLRIDEFSRLGRVVNRRLIANSFQFPLKLQAAALQVINSQKQTYPDIPRIRMLSTLVPGDTVNPG